MRSSELAALAGVTVRALRHYHQMGVLAEPERLVNGYRRYDVRHLVRVLRIVRLTGLGIPLAALPEVLDDPTAADAVLDELDREAAEEIDRLTARRETIAALRREAANPDMPAWLIAHAALFAEAENIAPDLARYEREQLILLGHLAGDSANEVLSSLYSRLDQASTSDREIYRRFDALGPDSSEEELVHLAEDFTAVYGPVLRELGERPELELAPRSNALLVEYADHTLNEQQRRTIDLFTARLTDTLQADQQG